MSVLQCLCIHLVFNPIGINSNKGLFVGMFCPYVCP